jgi:hypothetical protein
MSVLTALALADTPLVAQFGARNGQEFVQCIDYIAPYDMSVIVCFR